MSGWRIKQKLTICSLKEMHFKYKYINRLKMKNEKERYHTNTNQKKALEAILISEKVIAEQRKLYGLKKVIL